jgi:hypothetical protein
MITLQRWWTIHNANSEWRMALIPKDPCHPPQHGHPHIERHHKTRLGSALPGSSFGAESTDLSTTGIARR